MRPFPETKPTSLLADYLNADSDVHVKSQARALAHAAYRKALKEERTAKARAEALRVKAWEAMKIGTA
ncbi:hypothetical protein [Singulisphaera sp. PoT]|uniref:hypothetical protein n=1 Tax=Singulisphaera sp. PoT TaxID=3411797 RepID=UPI003BF49435